MKTQKAFTIIELMLAMAFLGTMLAGIASLIMQITNIYQKGLSIRNVNSVGREIVSDFTRTINSSRVNIDINPSGTDIKIDSVKAARSQYFLETKTDNKQMGGVFCTGSYSYVWNTADNLRIARGASDISISDGYVDKNAATRAASLGVFVLSTKDGKYRIPKLVRFADKNRDACYGEKTNESGNVLIIAKGEKGSIKQNAVTYFSAEALGIYDKDVVELISDNEADLALYDLSIIPATQNYTTKQIFYAGSFILATYRGGVNIMSNGDFCQGSSDDTGVMDSEYTGNDFNYCAVNKFNFSARATGETGINQHGEM